MIRPGWRLPTLAAALLFAAGLARDVADRWIDTTALPPLAVETGAEITARDGTLLRAFTVADGRWRLTPGPVDPLFTRMLIAYEDRHFADHPGIDPRAMLRAARSRSSVFRTSAWLGQHRVRTSAGVSGIVTSSPPSSSGR